MIMIMSIISVFMIIFLAFTLRHKRHERPYDYDYDCYVARGNQP